MAVKRLGSVLTLALLSASGCGDSDGRTTSGREAAEAPRCSESERLTVRDAVGQPAKGFRIVEPADPSAIEQLIKPILGSSGENKIQLDDAKVLVRRGAENGTIVVVLRSTADTGRARQEGDLVKGAQEAAESSGGAKVRPTRLNGHDGVIVEGPDATTAMAVEDDCAFIQLYDVRANDVERSLDALHLSG